MVEFLGNTADLEAALVKAGYVAEDASKKIAGSAASAGKAAQEQARLMGASADEQEAAAAKAAVAYTEAAAKITAAQRAAGNAAAQAAKTVGASVDEQRAAYTKAIATQAEVEAAAKRSAEAQEAAAARAKAAQASLAKFGGKAATVGLAALTGAAYEGVKGFTALQSQMEKLHTQAGATQAQVGTLTRGVLGMATSVGTGPQTLAEGMYHVTSSLNSTLPAASRASTELNVLRTAAEGAKVGGANLVDVTNALDGAIVSGMKGVQNYQQAMGALNATVGAGDMTMQDLADALGTGLTGPMRTYGVSLKDVSAALAVFGDNNIRGAEAGTRLASAIRIMSAPSAAAATALKAIGLSAGELGQDIRSKGLVSALQDLQNHLQESGATAEQQGLIITRAFGGRQSTGVQLLLAQLDRLKAKEVDVGNGAGTFNSSWNATTKTVSFQFDQLKATVQKLADEFGGYLVPKLEAAGMAVQSMIGWLEKHKAASEALAITIGGVLGTAVTVFAYTKAAAFVGATKDMITGMGNLSKGIASGATGIAAKLGLIGPAATAAAGESEAADTAMVVGAEGASAGIATALGATGVGAILVGLGYAVDHLVTHWQTAMTNMKNAVNAMVKAAETALNGLISALNTAISVFNSTIGQLTGDIGKVGKVSVGNVYNTSAGGGNANGSDLAPNAGSLKGGYNPTTFAVAALRDLGISPTTQNVKDFTAWEEQEGGNWQNDAKYNPLNTTMPEPGAGNTGAQGNIKVYKSWAQGLEATVATLKNYPGILDALKNNDSLSLFSSSVSSSPWGTGSILAQGVDLTSKQLQSILSQMNASSRTGGGTSGSAAAGGSSTNRQLNALLNSYLNGSSSKAAATSAIPVAVATMLSTANALIGTKYTSGGGHNGWDPVDELKKIGVDCSGFVSQVLHAGGISLPGPLTTQGLASDLQAGKGKYVTVYDRASGSQAHALIDILGKWFEAGGNSKYNPNPNHVSELTAKEAAGELSGGGFKAYHPIINGKMATDAQLKALGLSGIGSSALSSAGLAGEGTTTIEQLVSQIQQAAVKSASSLMQKYGNADQSGTLRTLENALGVSTSGAGVSSTLRRIIGRLGPSASIKSIDAATGPKYMAGFSAELTKQLSDVHGKALKDLDNILGDKHGAALKTLVSQLVALHGKALTSVESKLAATHQKSLSGVGADLKSGPRTLESITQVLNQNYAKSTQGKTYEQDVLNLIATGQTKEADRLVSAHKAAMATLAQEIYAEQLNKDTESLNQQNTALKDQTTAIQNAAQDAQQVVAAQNQRIQDMWGSATTALKDAGQTITDQWASTTTAMKDAAQTMTDVWAGAAQSIKDATALMSDQSGGIVQAIQDQTQIQVDQIGERGLYGLNLVAQQLTVQYDVTKAGFDAQISQAQQQLDVLQTQADQQENLAQINVDQVTAQQDMLVAQAQANLDSVTAMVDVKVAAAQAHLDSVTIQQDQRIASAQAHADAIQLKMDTEKIGPAQTAVDLGATLPKAQQDVLNAQLAKVTALANIQTNQAQQQYQTVYGSANAAIGTAQGAYNATSGAASYFIQQSQNAYNATNGAAQVAMQQASNNLANITGYFNQALAQANENLQGLSDAAAQTEASMQGAASVAQARASTEFAGTGTQINIYGVPQNNATQIASELDWVARTQLTLAQ